jgi:putative phosphoesterase
MYLQNPVFLLSKMFHPAAGKMDMRIGILSDTHITRGNKTLPQKVIEILSSVDAIIHAGDYQDISVVETLTELKDFYGVCGNMDSGRIRAALPEKRVVELNGFKIGITHGWGAPNGIESRVKTFFPKDDLNAIVFGHSHTPCNKIIDNILFFNPGSPTDKRHAEHRTMGILTLDKTISGEIITLE